MKVIPNTWINGQWFLSRLSQDHSLETSIEANREPKISSGCFGNLDKIGSDVLDKEFRECRTA